MLNQFNPIPSAKPEGIFSFRDKTKNPTCLVPDYTSPEEKG